MVNGGLTAGVVQVDVTVGHQGLRSSFRSNVNVLPPGGSRVNESINCIEDPGYMGVGE